MHLFWMCNNYFIFRYIYISNWFCGDINLPTGVICCMPSVILITMLVGCCKICWSACRMTGCCPCMIRYLQFHWILLFFFSSSLYFSFTFFFISHTLLSSSHWRLCALNSFIFLVVDCTPYTYEWCLCDFLEITTLG